MTIIDETLTISEYIAEKGKEISRGNSCGNGEPGWCRFMYAKNGMRTYKPLFKKERAIEMQEKFEIWNERIVAIPKDVWDIVFPRIENIVKDFEQKTNQAITIKKVDGPTEWADY
jgi:hypothetical protein